ncbi:MAG: hypothetical protein RL596_2143 [Bacteroidota bacterium]|jgi:hypothetical protein
MIFNENLSCLINLYDLEFISFIVIECCYEKNQNPQLNIICINFSIYIIFLQKEANIIGNDIRSSKISFSEIKAYTLSLAEKLKEKPDFLFSSMEERNVNGKLYVRLPLSGQKENNGSFYFTKLSDGKIQALYILALQPKKSALDGVVGFIDFDTKKFTAVTYKNNKPQTAYELNDSESFFSSGILKGNSFSASIKNNDACTEQTSVIKLPDGTDSVALLRGNSGAIPCPREPSTSFWQRILNFLGDVWSAISGAFNWLFSWGGSSGGSYTGGSFGAGGYYNWGFGGFTGSGASNCQYCSYDPGGSGWGPYDPFAGNNDPLAGKELAPDNFATDHYWEDFSYDNNDSINPPTSYKVYDQNGYRKNGSVYHYSEGDVQNYTDDKGNKYSTFTKNSNGEIIFFPGATITNFGVKNNRGATTSNGGIHADLSFSLARLQHEYGHYLQALKYGSFVYNTKIALASIWNMYTSPATHDSFWTEIEANQLAIGFFGNSSDIANKPGQFPR